MILGFRENTTVELRNEIYGSLDYVGPRRLSINQYGYGIIGFDGKDISQAQDGMRAKEWMEIRSNQIDPFQE